MSARAKVIVLILLITIGALAVWQFTSPPLLSPVGTKYTSQQLYNNHGTWIIPENVSNGRLHLAFSIGNRTYPKTTFSTEYSLVMNILNQTITTSYVRGFGVRVTSLSIQDNYDGSSTKWGIGIGPDPTPPDAVTVIGTFDFHTSAVHQLRFTLSFQLYDLLPLGYLPDKMITDSFNITQTVV